ncbi:MAG: biopolymer transporter ExbD [Spartobacteria bacterium]|nr:biopolymer transporter ExbD [Spartobacteria bacterium]
MARTRKRPDSPAAELEMTPMIDVVFQLLIYFIVTTKPVDVITNLDVFRPAPDPNAPKDQKPPNLVRVGVFQDGYTVNDVRATPERLDEALAKVASIDAGQTIMITVSAVSDHGQLVEALNLCAKNGLKSLSVVSASN